MIISLNISESDVSETSSSPLKYEIYAFAAPAAKNDAFSSFNVDRIRQFC